MANSVFLNLPETPCMFKPVGISKHQDTARLLQLDEMLKLVNGEINVKQRRVLDLYYHQGLTFREIEGEMGYSSRWLMELRKKAVTVLKEKVHCL